MGRKRKRKRKRRVVLMLTCPPPPRWLGGISAYGGGETEGSTELEFYRMVPLSTIWMG